MYRQDRLRAWRDCGLDLAHVHVERCRIDVYEYWTGTRVADRRGRGDESEGDGDHFIIGANTSHKQSEVQRAGARVDPNGVLGSAVPREVLLEGRYFLAQDELATFEHTSNCLVDFWLDTLVLSFKINKRDHAY